MSIRTTVTRGFGNGTFNGTIPLVVTRGYVLASSAAITGTAAGGLLESDVVTGGKTIIITLTNDTWVSAGATFNAIRQDIIDGLDSAQSETTGWNNEVRDKEVVSSVVRTSDTVVTVTLSAAAAYDISATETITITIPATAVNGGSAIVATPTFDVSAVAVDETVIDPYSQEERIRRRARERQTGHEELVQELSDRYHGVYHAATTPEERELVTESVSEVAPTEHPATPPPPEEVPWHQLTEPQLRGIKMKLQLLALRVTVVERHTLIDEEEAALLLLLS